MGGPQLPAVLELVEAVESCAEYSKNINRIFGLKVSTSFCASTRH